MLRCFGKLVIPNEDVSVIANALAPDNTGWCRSYSDSGNLIVEIETKSTSSMINSMEDFFINIKAAFSTLSVLKSFRVK